jgi:hypothetical protein
LPQALGVLQASGLGVIRPQGTGTSQRAELARDGLGSLRTMNISMIVCVKLTSSAPHRRPCRFRPAPLDFRRSSTMLPLAFRRALKGAWPRSFISMSTGDDPRRG